MNCRGLVAGVDEAGRGPLAGPVVVAAVILDPARPIAGLADSKVLSPLRREQLAMEIRAHALAFSVIEVGVDEIDRLNILQATLVGMTRAVCALLPAPMLVLIDGNQLPRELPCSGRAIIDGDASEPAISAASILAKVARDARMCEFDALFPGYDFTLHKGYATVAHRAALQRLGPCPQHRRSFAPVRQLGLFA
jgi:ribonuclease HII